MTQLKVLHECCLDHPPFDHVGFMTTVKHHAVPNGLLRISHAVVNGQTRIPVPDPVHMLRLLYRNPEDAETTGDVDSKAK